MPMISIDLPKMRHGYEIQADQVLWVSQGILNSGNLRDSLDEQCIADIVGSIVGRQVLDRTKDALDHIYDGEHEESKRIIRCLDSYGKDRLAQEFNFCISEIRKIVAVKPDEKLQQLLFTGTSHNPFPNMFALLVIALHESLIIEKRSVGDYAGLRSSLENLSKRFDATKKGTLASERRKNVDTIKGLIAKFLVDGESSGIYSNASIVSIDEMIQRSILEVARFELKQGILSLGAKRTIDKNVIPKVIKTVCAIANCGLGVEGVVLIGVADKARDADRIANIDKIVPYTVGERRVVGVIREARALNITSEQYVGMWKQEIRNSQLSEPLKSAVLSSLDFNNYMGLGVLVIRVPAQRSPSYVDDIMYIREGDETVAVKSAPSIAGVSQRFAK